MSGPRAHVPLVPRGPHPSGGRQAGIGWFVAAAVLGLLHAAPSAAWAAGSTFLLETVAAQAAAIRSLGAAGAAAVLGGIAFAKGCAAVVPLIVELRRPRGRRFCRAVTLVGAVVLVVWGLYGMTGAALLLAGVVAPASGALDVPGALGHLLLWDPLFAAWGVVLLVGLRRSRDGR